MSTEQTETKRLFDDDHQAYEIIQFRRLRKTLSTCKTICLVQENQSQLIQMDEWDKRLIEEIDSLDTFIPNARSDFETTGHKKIEAYNALLNKLENIRKLIKDNFLEDSTHLLNRLSLAKTKCQQDFRAAIHRKRLSFGSTIASASLLILAPILLTNTLPLALIVTLTAFTILSALSYAQSRAAMQKNLSQKLACTTHTHEVLALMKYFDTLYNTKEDSTPSSNLKEQNLQPSLNRREPYVTSPTDQNRFFAANKAGVKNDHQEQLQSSLKSTKSF